MKTLTLSQFKILSGFFSNIAVVWFTAAFINPSGILFTFQYTFTGILSLALALRLGRDVE